MADTAVSPNNARIKFRGKPEKEPVAKGKPTTGAPATREMGGMEKDYEAESALDTMQRAEEHQANPDMMKRVATHAKKKADGMAGVMEKLRKQGLVSDKEAEKVARRSADAK